MSILSSFIKRDDDVAWRIIEEEALVVNPKDSMIYPLNETGARVWDLLDGQKQVSAIIDIIAEEFEEDNFVIQQDILDFVKGLLDKGLAKQCA